MKKLLLILLVFVIEGLVLWGVSKVSSVRSQDMAYISQSAKTPKIVPKTSY